MADAAAPARILETRKTAPGLRLVDKWAVYITSLVLLLQKLFWHSTLKFFIDVLTGIDWWRPKSQDGFI